MPYDLSQRHKEDRTAAERIPTAAVRTTYEMNNDFGLGHMSLKRWESLAIFARLPYKLASFGVVISYIQYTSNYQIECMPPRKSSC